MAERYLIIAVDTEEKTCGKCQGLEFENDEFSLCSQDTVNIIGAHCRIFTVPGVTHAPLDIGTDFVMVADCYPDHPPDPIPDPPRLPQCIQAERAAKLASDAFVLQQIRLGNVR